MIVEKNKNQQKEKKGKIHSFESFGTKDGPGIRFVLFLQGCPLRCLYCHNPDTWKISQYNYELSAQETFAEIAKVKLFIRNGGVTVSGGEPLMQAEFVTELFDLCKRDGIHTTIDTSGFIMNSKVENALKLTDLVMLDIKHINPQKYKKLTSKELEESLKFMEHLQRIGKATWLRYVLVPGYSDDEQDLHNWAKYASQFDVVQRVDILPFHQMGKAKWENAGLDYKLNDVNAPDIESIKKAEDIFRQYHLPIA